MENTFIDSLRDLPFIIISLVIAFSVHEFAHAYTAYKFGDNTAAREGRLTLSPRSHIDPIGAIAIFLLGFGWARPVPVNPRNFKNPRTAGILVSLAGPASNLILATIGMFILIQLVKLGISDGSNYGSTLTDFFQVFIQLNVILFVFNLLPIPPLDGYRIIFDLVPRRVQWTLNKYEAYGMIIFLILVITPLNAYTIGYLFRTVVPGIMYGLQGIFV
ncbi:MAG: peptidase family protein [Bacillales bacterium]|nr:peptidase family protein [Bacillales bacterium]